MPTVETEGLSGPEVPTAAEGRVLATANLRDFEPISREWAVFYARCKLLEDIAYGVSTGARPNAESGLAHLARTFGEFA